MFPKILCVVGARPNFMKIAPIMAALRQPSVPLAARLVHTGQHYDVAMNQQFFQQLGIPTPDVDLEVGSASHAVQTAEIMKRFEPVVDAEQPAAVLVVGDVNSTIACALVAAKKGIRVIHVEAGLRSYDRTMPEEINRVLTDQISDLLFITERAALAHLTREGIESARVHFVGNVMIDTLRASLPRATPPAQTLATVPHAAEFLNESCGYGVLTLHRPSNVDDPVALAGLLTALSELSTEVPLVFPVHPRTRGMIEKAGLSALLDSPRCCCLPPLGYLEMLGLMQRARLVLTDSGGIQEETTALGVPCLTLRENTERPITVTEGTNTVVGIDPERILAAAREVLTGGGKAGRIPECWDGHAAERITAVLVNELGSAG
ncbi:non-hydrolyzing UDP-N-acetylglucosamine 2-epimerase [Candidatus Contendibacter odensensis]|uniref:UDP-N-acetylglucosamine 2-epimerase n=1 Tax=Candidatus Contendobacter odensis Run_B_J11 TaxID=1400861 RepID=A0A7U7GEB3_9GAMM|nr:UDP-N-acetylglucosamine 2-epimerase (non-hydrolyzing) [Candidatus Contendobacter odensis]CDH46810.1 UDP-N-acetylglucosamine 2-epimerase [Candidatus Contendobacter odensis Run_B_J11]